MGALTDPNIVSRNLHIVLYDLHKFGIFEKCRLGGSLALNIHGYLNREVHDIDIMCSKRWKFPVIQMFNRDNGDYEMPTNPSSASLRANIERISFRHTKFNINICLFIVENDTKMDECDGGVYALTWLYGKINIPYVKPEVIINAKRDYITNKTLALNIKEKHLNDVKEYEALKDYPCWFRQGFNNRVSGYWKYSVNGSSGVTVQNLNNNEVKILPEGVNVYGTKYIDHFGNEKFLMMQRNGFNTFQIRTAQAMFDDLNQPNKIRSAFIIGCRKRFRKKIKDHKLLLNL